MKHMLIFLALALSAHAAHAAGQFHFNCKSVNKLEGKTVRVSFDATVGAKKADLIYPQGDDLPFKVTPSDSVMGELNDNTGFGLTATELKVHGDGDGIVYVDMGLYRNSGFTKGYMRWNDGAGFGHRKEYSPIFCQVTQQ